MSSDDNKVEGSEPITIRVRDQVSQIEEKEGETSDDLGHSNVSYGDTSTVRGTAQRIVPSIFS
jgi:hypothetical protein